jgi:hypothetical protein
MQFASQSLLGAQLPRFIYEITSASHPESKSSRYMSTTWNISLYATLFKWMVYPQRRVLSLLFN